MLRPVFTNSNKDSQAIGPGHLWDTKEVAAFLNVKESTIRNWVHIGYIPHIKFRGAVRYQRIAIDQWIKAAWCPKACRTLGRSPAIFFGPAILAPDNYFSETPRDGRRIRACYDLDLSPERR